MYIRFVFKNLYKFKLYKQKIDDKLCVCEGNTFTLIQLLTFKRLIHSTFTFVKV